MKRGKVQDRGGGLHVKVKTTKGRASSSIRWLERQLNDPYVREAKTKGYRSRAAFKLIELDTQYHFLSKGMRVLDLGAAPGGWSQVAAVRVGPSGKVVAADVLEMEPLGGVAFLQADLTDADQRFKRSRDLVAQGIASRQDLDQAQAKLQSAQADYESTLNSARNLVQEIERTRGAVELQRKKLRDTAIRAPFDAQVKERMVNAGSYVKASTPVFALVKTNPIRMRIEVPERMAPWIKNGQVADVSLEAYPGHNFEGKVWRISPTVDQAKRTFVVEALIENARGELKPGSYAKATVHTARNETIRIVPTASLNYVFGANKVYVVKNNVVDAREVKLGDRFGDEVEVAEGVEDGDQVAISQISRLETGTHVTVNGTPVAIQ